MNDICINSEHLGWIYYFNIIVGFIAALILIGVFTALSYAYIFDWLHRYRKGFHD